jgi:hypothetical protein
VTHTINSEINFRICRRWEGNASTIDTYSYLSANIRKKFAEPCVAAVYGYVDALIHPRDTRTRTIAALEVLDGQRTRIHTPKQPEKVLYCWQISPGTLRRPELDMRYLLNETLGPLDSLSGR